jgi:hypothetical protein
VDVNTFPKKMQPNSSNIDHFNQIMSTQKRRKTLENN